MYWKIIIRLKCSEATSGISLLLMLLQRLGIQIFGSFLKVPKLRSTDAPIHPRFCVSSL